MFPYLWPILQTAVAATVTWEIARRWLHHGRPIFAAITAIVAMGFTAGRRGRKAALIVIGVALGIVLGDLLLRNIGSGSLQIGITVFVAMTLALVVSRDSLFVTQVGISALLLVALGPESGSRRLEDALLGGGIALVFSVLLFPIDPVASVRRSASPVLGALVRSLEDAAGALATGDLTKAEAARAVVVDQAALLDAIAMALDTTRLAPRRRRDRAQIEELAAAAGSLAAISRGARVLAGAVQRMVRDGEAPQPELAAAVASLAAAVDGLRRWLETDSDDALAAAREQAANAVRLVGVQPQPAGLAAATVAHLVETLATHVLRVTGLGAGDVQALLAGSP